MQTKFISLKQWRSEQAQKLGVKDPCFNNMLYTGRVKYPKVVRVNKRVVLVRTS